VVEFKAGYGAELGAADGVNVGDSKVDIGLRDTPVPVALPDAVGMEVPFDKG
jgi:hypothetical protein